jgi:hypothetical protein
MMGCLCPLYTLVVVSELCPTPLNPFCTTWVPLPDDNSHHVLLILWARIKINVTDSRLMSWGRSLVTKSEVGIYVNEGMIHLPVQGIRVEPISLMHERNVYHSVLNKTLHNLR